MQAIPLFFKGTRYFVYLPPEAISYFSGFPLPRLGEGPVLNLVKELGWGLNLPKAPLSERTT